MDARLTGEHGQGEDRYRRIVEGVDDFAIITTDALGIITSWNSGARRIVGYLEAEAVGQPGALIFTPEDREAGAPDREMNLAASNGRAVNERWHVRKDGGRFWGSGLMMPLEGPGGGYVKIFRDATAQHQAEAALRESEARLSFLDRLGAETAPLADADAVLATTTRMLGEHLGLSVCAYADMDEDQDGFTIRGDWAAPGATSIVGHYRLADFGRLAVKNLSAGQPLVINDNLREIAPEEAATFQSIGIAATICMPLVKNGRLAALMAIHDNVPRFWTDAELSLLREVTARSWAHVERVAAAAELRDTEERLRLAVDNAEVGFWDVDLVNDELIWPPRTKAMFGISADVPVTMQDFYDALHPDDRELTSAAFAAAADPERRALYDVEYRTIGKEDGVVRWVAAKGRGVFDETGRCVRVAGTAVDITARKAAAAALAESEERYRTLFNSIESGFCVVEVNTAGEGGKIDYRVVEANPGFYRQTGFPEQIFGEWLRSAAPQLEEHWFETYGRVAVTGEPVRFEQRSDHLGRWFDVYAFRVGEPEEQRVAILFTDISARREAEEQLRDLNHKLEERVLERTAERNRVWEMSRDLLAIMGFDGKLKAINPAWEFTFGLDTETLLASSFREQVHPDDHAAVEAMMERLSSGETVHRFEDRIRHADGSWRWISWTLVPERDVFYAVGRDVTADKQAAAELEHAQEALRQSQKMEAIGQLTGGVAHDFNNLLTPIIGSLDLLQRKGLGNERERRLIEGALQSADRAKTLVQRLLAFARRQPLQAQAVDVAKLVTGMADLVASTSGPRVRVETDASPSLPAACADSNQLEMALLNLAVNARDAMPDGGTLTISAHEERVGAGHRAKLAPGRYVRLSVADTGAGMDEATLARAIEPFFSTKGVGKGTGLGLSMVHGLAAQLGGALLIHSQRGLGTCVELWLPATETAAPQAEEAGTAITSAAAGTALLVDDEELVRSSTADMLGDLGYAVVEASSAEEALRLVNGGLQFDLLVTDHLMPGMTGSELAREVRSRRPGAPVVLVSGYAEVDGVAPDLPRLAKPFRQADLAAKVAEISGT